jgi:hypothetical protein
MITEYLTEAQLYLRYSINKENDKITFFGYKTLGDGENYNPHDVHGFLTKDNKFELWHNINYFNNNVEDKDTLLFNRIIEIANTHFKI